MIERTGNPSMSFSSDVKQELLTIENKPCCSFAQSYGFLLFGRSFSASGLSFMTDHAVLAEAYAEALQQLGGGTVEPKRSEAGRYSVTLSDSKRCRRVLSTLGYDGSEYRIRLNFANIRDDCCRAAFIRGAFLACGSVTDPEREYHLELTVGSKSLATDFMKLFDEYNSIDPDQNYSLQPRLSTRGGVYLVYLKDSSSIEDFLAIIGAQNAALKMMNAKVFKDIKNNVNRRVNFETANINRSVNAAVTQIDAIRKIMRYGALGQLPEDMQHLAVLRLEEQEMSLRELGEAMQPPMSRAAVNYRLKKILEFAQQLP